MFMETVKTMKRAIYIFAVLLTAAACNEPDPVPETIPLSVDPTSLEFAAEGGEQTISVKASEQVYLVPGDNWLSAKKGESVDAMTTVTVTASANETYEPRETRLSVVAGDEKIYVTVSQAASVFVPGPPPVESEGKPWEVAADLGAGWNLGNQMDAHVNGVADETSWGNPKTTKALFDWLKQYGFKSVRIPVTWMGHVAGAPDYRIQDEWLDRVAEIVGYAEQAGLNAIINMHHDGADSQYWLDIATAAVNSQVNAEITDRFSKMWSQIAERFKDKGDFLIFESFNELHDGGWGWGANRNDGGKQYACLNAWNQAFVDAVRAVGGQNSTRYLSVAGYCANPDMTIEYLELPADTAEGRLIVAVHCYDPYEYCITGKYSEWGHTGAAGKKDPDADEKTLEKTFDNLKKAFIDKGIPVYIGEMGCVSRTDARAQAFQQYYLEYFAKLAKSYGIAPFLWDNGAKGGGNESHAFIDHATGMFVGDDSKAAVEAFVGGINNEDPDYTLETVYNSAPKQ